MDRRAFVAGTVGIIAGPRGAVAQQPLTMYRIGTLTVSPADRASHFIHAFEERLRELGYIKGSNISFEHRFADGRPERLPEMAGGLATLNVDVIIAGNNASIAAAKRATSRIPIVMTYGADPVGVGFVASLARPGGNITGLTADVTEETWGKRLGLIKEIAPRVSHVTVLWNPDFPGSQAASRATEEATARLGVRLQWVAVRRLEDFDSAFASLTQRPGGLLIFADPLTYTRRREIAAAAIRHGIPAMYAFREGTDDGGLMSYGVNIPALYVRAAYFTDRILKGARPRDLPIEQPSQYELVINLKTAKALGLTIPPSLLLRADEVIDR